MTHCEDCKRQFTDKLKCYTKGICQKCYDHRRWVKAHPEGPVKHCGVIGRFLKYLKLEPNGCWTWTGSRLPSGYGTFYLSKKQRHIYAHRFSYQACNGLDLTEKQIHHVCGNKACVNPNHLQDLTVKEHMRITPGTFPYVQSRKTHCPQGHPYNLDNTRYNIDKYGREHRSCRKCNTELQRKRKEARMAAAVE